MSKLARAGLTIVLAMIAAAVASPATPIPDWLRPILAAGLLGGASVGIVPPQLIAMPGAVSTGYFTKPSAQKINEGLKIAKSIGMLPPDGIIRSKADVPQLADGVVRSIPDLPPGARWIDPANFSKGYYYPRPGYGSQGPEERL